MEGQVGSQLAGYILKWFILLKTYKCSPGPVLNNFVDHTDVVHHYTMPQLCLFRGLTVQPRLNRSKSCLSQGLGEHSISRRSQFPPQIQCGLCRITSTTCELQVTASHRLHRLDLNAFSLRYSSLAVKHLRWYSSSRLARTISLHIQLHAGLSVCSPASLSLVLLVCTAVHRTLRILYLTVTLATLSQCL